MNSLRIALVTLLFPAAGLGQGVAARPAATYRGFTPGASYREFVERGRTLAHRDTLRCNTSRNTAQLMECGVVIRDPADGATFYLSAYVLEAKLAMVALYDSAGFGGDGGGAALVDRTKRDLTRVFGRPRPIGNSGWEWKRGRQVVRLNWRGRDTARWVSITLTDNGVMDGISRYAKAASSRKP
jgi:hypothetical protein